MTARALSAALSLALSAAALQAPPLFLLGCSKRAGAESGTKAKTYATRGTIKSFAADKKLINIAHEDIPGYMSAMTMSFEPKDAAQLAGLAVGDKIAFSFTDDDGRRVLVTIAKSP